MARKLSDAAIRMYARAGYSPSELAAFLHIAKSTSNLAYKRLGIPIQEAGGRKQHTPEGHEPGMFFPVTGGNRFLAHRRLADRQVDA